MTELKDRFARVEGVGAPELWGEVRRRAAEPEAPPRAIEWPPGAARRAAVGALAFAVFAVAVVFAWDLTHTSPAPPPGPAIDLSIELPTGWSELPPPPEVRSDAATAWTGSELLVWGGYEFVGTGDDSPDPDGFAFDAAARTWEQLPAAPLSGRASPAAAWTGREMLIWGGSIGECCLPSGEGYLADGGAFDPVTRTWRSLPAAPIRGRVPFSVWTGDELIVWGNADQSFRMRDGAAYDPQADAWRTIADAPLDLTAGSAVWTGREMIVFGARLDLNNHADTRTAIGAAYDPAADTWRELPPSDLSPQAMTASWLNNELIAWDYDQASAAYDPDADAWRKLERVPLAFSECRPVSVATSGTVFGEFCGKTVVFSPQEDAWHRDPMPVPEVEGGCCWVHEPSVAGDVVLVPSLLYDEPPQRTSASDRRMYAYNPPSVVQTDARGEVAEPEPFLPATSRDGDHLRMPVVFPDGSEGTLIYPIALGLETMGVQPDVSYVWRDDPPPRFKITFLHDANVSIATYVEGRDPVTVLDVGAEIWTMSDEWESHYNLLQGVWIRLRLDSWTVLVASTTVEDATEVAEHLDVRGTPSGFPVVKASGPLALARGFGEAEGPQLALGDARAEPDVVSQLDAAIFLSPDGCTSGSEKSGTYGSSCLADGSVFASIYGDREFVANVVDGLRVEDFRPA